MKNEIYEEREKQINKATDVYNQIVDESKNLTNSQINQIDNFNKSEADRINNSINQNISNLETANNTLEKRYKNELQGAKQDYDNISLPLNETNRIIAENAMKNRQYTATESREQAYQEYLNQSERAKLSGDSTIAQLALNTLKEKINYMSSMNKYNNQLQLNMIDNNRNLENEYWNRQTQYNSALNDINSLEEDKRQYNETMAYQKAQDKIENNLNEKEYQLALKKARASANKSSSSSSKSISSSANTTNLTNPSNQANINNVSETGGNDAFGGSSETKYYCNYCPQGLSDDGLKTFNKIAKKVDKNTYVTADYIEKMIKKLPSDQQGIILSAFKVYGGGGGSR